MSRLHYLSKFSQNWRKTQKRLTKRTKSPALEKCPQKRGICIKIFFRTPRKPNSAIRKVAKIQLARTLSRVIAYIPGINHTLQQ